MTWKRPAAPHGMLSDMFLHPCWPVHLQLKTLPTPCVERLSHVPEVLHSQGSRFSLHVLL